MHKGVTTSAYCVLIAAWCNHRCMVHYGVSFRIHRYEIDPTLCLAIDDFDSDQHVDDIIIVEQTSGQEQLALTASHILAI
jgi:hypothetical protein